MAARWPDADDFDRIVIADAADGFILVAEGTSGLSVRKVAAWAPVTPEILVDSAQTENVLQRMRSGARRLLWPSDPNPMPRIHLFRWSRRRAA